MYNFLIDIMADLSTAITMEDFFNTFLKRKKNQQKNNRGMTVHCTKYFVLGTFFD